MILGRLPCLFVSFTAIDQFTKKLYDPSPRKFSITGGRRRGGRGRSCQGIGEEEKVCPRWRESEALEGCFAGSAQEGQGQRVCSCSSGTTSRPEGRNMGELVLSHQEIQRQELSICHSNVSGFPRVHSIVQELLRPRLEYEDSPTVEERYRRHGLRSLQIWLARGCVTGQSLHAQAGGQSEASLFLGRREQVGRN